MIDLLNDFHQGLRVLGGHEKESALTNPKSYNMYFEQQINQKDILKRCLLPDFVMHFMTVTYFV